MEHYLFTPPFEFCGGVVDIRPNQPCMFIVVFFTCNCSYFGLLGCMTLLISRSSGKFHSVSISYTKFLDACLCWFACNHLVV